MKRFVYADNAATTQLDPTAFEAMKPFLQGSFGNPSQPYTFSKPAKLALKNARMTIGQCIGANPEEIYFTSGGTESDNWAIKGVLCADTTRCSIVTSSFEHHAVLQTCKAIENSNRPVNYVTPTRDGIVTVESLENALSANTRLVSIMTANNELGTIQQIKDLCETAHYHGAVFHTDAVQAVGHIRVDVAELGVDLLSASAHKFNGPKGIGFLYVRKGTPMASFINGGMQERGMRAGTENVASIVGMATALKRNCEELEGNEAYVRTLEAELLHGLAEANIRFLRNGNAEMLPGVMSISFENMDGEAILHRMDLQGICISTGSACNSENTEISHVLKAIMLDENLAKGTVRISLGKNNTYEDIRAIVDAFRRVLNS